MKKLLLAVLILSAAHSVRAATCTVMCSHSVETVIMRGDAHADHGEFAISCREMGGSPHQSGSYLTCKKNSVYTTTESGSGSSNYEARVAANKACSSQSCSNRGYPPWCPTDTLRHSANPSGDSCN